MYDHWPRLQGHVTYQQHERYIYTKDGCINFKLGTVGKNFHVRYATRDTF